MPDGRDSKAEDIEKIILELDEMKGKVKYVITIVMLLSTSSPTTSSVGLVWTSMVNDNTSF